MATYAELLAEVYVHTKRPDLTAETAAMVKKATMKLHGRNQYKQDIKEVTKALPVSSTYRYTIDLSIAADFPRYRKIMQLKEYNATPTGQEKVYDELAADNLFDAYNLEKTDYFYIAGTTLQLRTATNTGNVKATYWQYPDVTVATFTSWIAAQYPDAIAEEAARMIFKMIGHDDQFQKYELICKENEAILDGIGI